MQHQFRHHSPCRGCKKRRRGCYWKENCNICERCLKFQLECVQFDHDPDDDDDVLPKEFSTKTIEYWQYQLNELENELQEAEYRVELYSKPSPEEIEWKLSIDQNGLLKLHTAITTLEELIMYSRASLRYLSPFGGLFHGTPIRFENSAVIYSMRGFCSMINGALVPTDPHPLPVYRDHWISENDSYRPIIDELIHMYLKHRNPHRPLLHAPTFLEHYRRLSDPLSCPVTLAVCVSATCHIRQLGNYSVLERRQMAEFFYTKAKDILLEIFDDPKRKIETLYTITFLYQFIIYVLLQPLEARRLATIALLICEDLQPTFEMENSYTEVERTLFERHYLYTKWVSNFLAFIIDHNVSNATPMRPFLLTLPGEDECTVHLIEAHNRLNSFAEHPCISGLLEEVQLVIRGKSDQVSVERIFRLDEIVREWWQETPAHLRLCDDLFSKDASAAIEQKPSLAKLVVFAFTHSTLVRIHACIITPKHSTSPESTTGVTEEALLMLSERSRSILLRSCDSMLEAILYLLTAPEDLPPLTFKFVFRAIHALLSIACSSNNQLAVPIQEKFYQCISKLFLLFPQDTQIPAHLSPLNAFLSSQTLGDFGVYRRHSALPGYAFMCDFLRATHEHLQYKLENRIEVPRMQDSY